MKFYHDSSYFYKFDTDSFDVQYDYTNDLGTGDSVASATVVCTDSDGNDTTSSMISNKSIVTPDVYFTVSGGTVGKLYSIKIIATSSNSKIYTGFISFEVFGSVTLNSNLGDSSANSYVTLSEANDYIMNKYGHSNTWDTMTIEGRKRVLIQATKDIDSFNFYGSKYYASQSLQFPRNDHSTKSGTCATPFSISSFKNSNLYSTTYGVYPDDYWKYGSCHIVTGTPQYNIRLISDSVATNGLITVSSDFDATPTASSTFIVFSPLDSVIKAAQCEQALYIIQTNSMQSIKNYKAIDAQRVKIGDVDIYFKNTSQNDELANVSPTAKRLLNKFIDRSYRVDRA